MLEQLTTVLRNYKSDDSLQVAETTTFEELSLDSLDVVQLIMDIEEEFGVTIELDKSMKDVGSLLTVIAAAKS
ncbi:MAG: phosphopantetheine-binding protein [Defluviitaleaceae bacterium]|nr:phosphopantetheine-binding protein [Defluviitaleaceae bacterium]